MKRGGNAVSVKRLDVFDFDRVVVGFEYLHADGKGSQHGLK